MKSMVWAFFCIPLIVPIAIFEGVEPFRAILHDLVETFAPELMDKYPMHVTLALLLTRFVICTFVAVEIGRFYAIFFLFFICGIIIYIDYIEKVLEGKQHGKTVQLTDASFLDYHNCQLVINILNPVLKHEIACLMFTGLMIAVVSNVAIVQCYEVFPWYLYYSCILVNILTLTIIYCTLPFGTESFEKTLNALDQWKAELGNCSLGQLRIMKRMHRSLKPVYVTCGTFFKLERETKSGYFDSIWGYCIDCNMSIDFKSLLTRGF